MLTQRETIDTVVHGGYDSISRSVAGRVASLIRRRNEAGETTVLGLATGSTPIGIYRELVRRHRENDLDFSRVVTFNLDEYYPMGRTDPHSYHSYMREIFFEHVNVREENVHLPSGELPEEELEDHCRAYEEAIREAGGIDYQILGIGRTGHIGFNEPGSGPDTRTRRVHLDPVTRRDAASEFFGEQNVPEEGITMGIGTILEADEIALIATGEHKARVVRRTVEGPVDPAVPATFLQRHPEATVHLDRAAAARLTRVATPWLLGDVDWTPERRVQAVAWLSEEVGKSILRLETADYREHHLSPLLSRHGPAPRLNGEVFNALMDKVRGRSDLPRGNRILVFSPHPDDDVISMGGILRKLRQNGNDLTVAYQTSGNVAVYDHEVRRYTDLLRRLEAAFGGETVKLRDLPDRIDRLLSEKEPGAPDEPVVRDLKRVIRESEAVAGVETLGLDRAQTEFLNLPFYRTGRVRKEPVGSDDVAAVRSVLESVRPEIVFAAGDLSDPHGTHRKCFEAVRRALAAYDGPDPELWLYRGAWSEWPVSRADVLVPMSEEELHRKVQAIYKHESQKDTPPFPGPDEREFWERARARNRGTADRLDRLGLPEYYAIEAYVVAGDDEQPGAPPMPEAD